MNKNLNILIFAFFCMFFASCSDSKKHNLKMNVIVNNQPDGEGNYEQVLHIINKGNLPLEKNWELNTTFFKRFMNMDEDSPIDIKHINGTLHTLSPNDNYQILQPNDTLEIRFKLNAPFWSSSFAPDGAYIVFEDKNLNNGKPLQIESEIITPDNEEFVNSISYYATGDNIYNENLNYIGNNNVSQGDIIPSVKEISYNEDSLKLIGTFSVNLTDNELSNEKELLTKSLEKLGYKINTNGVKINISLDSSIEKNDGYLLQIKPDEINIIGNDKTGAFYGATTLISILSVDTNIDKLQCMDIVDFPDFAYRGMMIDVARNFTSKENILSLIDILSLYKINKLHLHLTDDEGWRIEIPGIEELTEIASKRGVSDKEQTLQPMYYSHWDVNHPENLGTGFYRKEDYKDILRYAKDRHISVIPEIDVPGHSQAAIIAMNARYEKYKDTDLAKAEEYLLIDPNDPADFESVQNYYGNTVNPVMNSTYAFVEKVLDEMQQTYDEAGIEMEVLHIGGDEVPKGAWDKSPLAQKYMEENNIKEARELKDLFVQKVVNSAQKKNIRLAGWQEIVMKPNESEIDEELVGSDVISYCWNTLPYGNKDEVPYKLANEGFDVILCNAPNLYFDCAYDKSLNEKGLMWAGYVNEINAFDIMPFDIYASMRRSSNGRRFTEEELKQNAKKAESKTQLKNKENILGIQAQLWSETIRNYDDVQEYLFPKVLGLSESAWNAEMLDNPNTVSNYQEAVSLFLDKISKHEYKKLSNQGVKFHIAPPGIIITDGKLYANSRVSDAEIRYTLDGSEPTRESLVWESPIETDSKLIKAKAFYQGAESPTSILFNKNLNVVKVD